MLLALLTIVVIAAAGAYYILSVRTAMQSQSITDIFEVTAQGRHAFDVYMSKNTEMLHNLTMSAAKCSSDDEEGIVSTLNERNGSDTEYVLIVPEKGLMYTNRSTKSRPVEKSEIDNYPAPDGRGVNETGISEFTGRNVLSCYERFTFTDGTVGIMISEMLHSSVSDEFSISFFGGTGFSHIVNDKGDILIRSNHKNSSRIVENIFDEINSYGNDEEKVRDFENMLAGRKSGMSKFIYRGDDYVFTYVPVENIDDWYFISIIPEDVITQNANDLVQSSQLLLFFISVVIVLFAAFLLVARQSNKDIMKKEHEIKYREQLFSILSNNTDDVFLMVTINGNAVEYVSPNIERVLGISEKDVLEDVHAVNRTLCSTENTFGMESMNNIKPGASVSFESERIHEKTGEHRWFNEIIYCAEIENTEKLIVVISDRTDEKQSKKALEDALNMTKAANEAKSTFLSNMSHDIRTPMNAIVGLSSLLQRDADNPEKVREHTRKIVSSSQHMLGIINDILDMSKIESGKATLNITEINLAEIVEELGTIIRPQAKAKNQTFGISVKDIQQEHLLGDKLRIEQIMINLLSNAVKYTSDGGNIEMVISQIPRSAKNYAHLRFVVRDNGMGMSAEYQQKIFAPFTREINSTTNKIQGTGLGMAITKNLVDLMGGTISVESVQGEGSTFTVDLELRMQKRDIDRSFWISHGVTHTLVVDDDVEVCTNIIGAMSGTGVAMQFAADGLSAVEMVKDAHSRGLDFNLVLLDWKMPGIDGVETARRIREVIPESVPIMILTAYDWTDIEKEAAEAGINGFLPKPFFLSNFRQAIERIDNGDGTLSGAVGSRLPENTRVLVAEDNEINAEILLELLSDIPGLVCVVAEDGKQALDKFESSAAYEFDIILMDVQMPNMNGYEATRAIRALNRPDAKTIPIVAMTANAFAEDLKDALDSGMNAHVPKPVDLDRILEVLREYTQKK